MRIRPRHVLIASPLGSLFGLIVATVACNGSVEGAPGTLDGSMSDAAANGDAGEPDGSPPHLDGALPEASPFPACNSFEVTLDGGVDAAFLPRDGGSAGIFYGGADDCRPLCGTYGASCSLYDPGPPVVVRCQPMCTGRRPEGLRTARLVRETLGGHFAAMSALEAASVPAFERLARELAAHGAPKELVAAARSARRDEVRHTRKTKRLAARFGAPTSGASARKGRVRSLAEIALENAVEGCVRETLGALLATWQAAHAKDPVVRGAMERIAADETRHAELARAVETWAHSRLSSKARQRIEDAKRRALEELLGSLSDAPTDIAAAVGLPSKREATALFTEGARVLGLAA